MKPKKLSNARIASSRACEVSLKTQLAVKRDSQQSACAGVMAAQARTSQSSKNFLYVCSGCNKPIKRDKFLLKACDKYWHENCLKCDRCHSRLGELGSTLYYKSNMNLCRQDYLEMFGETGVCSVCDKLICASEMVMRAKQNVYHLECFACQLCSQRFCVGDRFYLCENKVVCQYDYEEHILPIQRSLLGQTVVDTSCQPISIGPNDEPGAANADSHCYNKSADQTSAEETTIEGALNQNRDDTKKIDDCSSSLAALKKEETDTNRPRDVMGSPGESCIKEMEDSSFDA